MKVPQIVGTLYVLYVTFHLFHATCNANNGYTDQYLFVHTSHARSLSYLIYAIFYSLHEAFRSFYDKLSIIAILQAFLPFHAATETLKLTLLHSTQTTRTTILQASLSSDRPPRHHRYFLHTTYTATTTLIEHAIALL